MTKDELYDQLRGEGVAEVLWPQMVEFVAQWMERQAGDQDDTFAYLMRKTAQVWREEMAIENAA